MGYSREVYAKVGQIYDARRTAALADLDARIKRANAEIPELSEIDEKLSATGLRIMDAIRANDGGASFERVKKENEELVGKREELLSAHGFPRDYCDPHYLCPDCGDTGFNGGRRCACLKKALYDAQAALSGLGSLLGAQTFDNFDLSFYSDRDEALENKNFCIDFARGGYAAGQNLVLMGGTGVGKTHLSTAIADTAMRSGGSVIYESAPHVLDDFRYEQFGRGWNDRSPVRTDKYFDADLLIVDDLGSEMPGAFTTSVLYNLINTRLTEHRAMLFNTNLSQNELVSTYDRRIVSRVLSAFTVITLEGKDIRMAKLQGK